MPGRRYNVAYDHNNMIPSPAGKAAVQIIWEIEDGISHCYGTTVPVDTTAGYVEGCVFLKTDAATGLVAEYKNVGTALSCNFDLVVPVVAQATVTDPAGGATIDAEARTAIVAIIDALEAAGILA